MKKKHGLKTFFTIVITAVITFSVTLLYCYGSKKEDSMTSSLAGAFESDELLTKLDIIKDKINTEYMGEINEENLIEGAVKGYVAGLNDKYSEYFTKEEMDDYYEDTVGEYVGIGVYITKNIEKNEIEVYGTIKDSTAEASGLQKGDFIIAIDGVECNGDDYDTITDRIKGKAGTKVKIKVRRTANEHSSLNNNEINNTLFNTESIDISNDEILEFEIERKNVEIVRVTSQMLDSNIGYIYISSFDGVKVSNQFEDEYNKLKDSGAKSLIIDIRSNGGGIVDEAVEIGDLLTDKDENLLIEKDNKGNETVTKSKRDKKVTMKFALLVDRYSASASEILAGIVKDVVEEGTIIGETTYGKGIIQSLYKLSDGSGLKITTEQYFTPNHNEINKKGIEPDIVVNGYAFGGTLEIDKDTVLQKAIQILE